MNRFPGILFHTLKGINGWSNFSLKELDVAKIMSISYRERLFKIFDRDEPYSLEISYNHTIENTSVAPVFTGGKIGFSLYQKTTIEQSITKRYQTKKDVDLEFSEINHKMKKLDLLSEKLRRETEDKVIFL
jgi:hypothetical protein